GCGPARFSDPVAAVDNGGRFVGLAGGEALVFAAAGPPQDRAEQLARGEGDQAEFPLHFLAQRANPDGYGRVRRGETVLHGPQDRDPAVAQGAGLTAPALAYTGVRVVLVAQVAGE